MEIKFHQWLVKKLEIIVIIFSKYLKTLKEVELVECLNEEDKRYRFYHLTDKGRYYLDKVEKEYNDYF